MTQPYTAFFWDGPVDGYTMAVADNWPKPEILFPVNSPFPMWIVAADGNHLVLRSRTALYRRTYVSERLRHVIYEFFGMSQ